MSESNKYQGWANYPTWCVNLWLNNDEGLYRECQRLARRYDDPSDLANQLEMMVDELLPELEGFAADLLSFAVGRVDWYEIAEGFLEE